MASGTPNYVTSPTPPVSLTYYYNSSALYSTLQASSLSTMSGLSAWEVEGYLNITSFNTGDQPIFCSWSDGTNIGYVLIAKDSGNILFVTNQGGVNADVMTQSYSGITILNNNIYVSCGYDGTKKYIHISNADQSGAIDANKTVTSASLGTLTQVMIGDYLGLTGNVYQVNGNYCRITINNQHLASYPSTAPASGTPTFTPTISPSPTFSPTPSLTPACPDRRVKKITVIGDSVDYQGNCAGTEDAYRLGDLTYWQNNGSTLCWVGLYSPPGQTVCCSVGCSSTSSTNGYTVQLDYGVVTGTALTSLFTGSNYSDDIIVYGTQKNDANLATNTTTYYNTFYAGVTQLAAILPGINIVLQTSYLVSAYDVTPYNTQTRLVGTNLRAAGYANVTVMDEAGLSVAQCDNVHPTVAGYVTMSNFQKTFLLTIVGNSSCPPSSDPSKMDTKAKQ